MPFIIAIFSVGFMYLAAFVLTSSPPMDSQPALSSAFEKSAAHDQLIKLGVSEVELRCSWKTLYAKFEFADLDGREPVEVASTTPCTDAGPLVVVKYGYLARARENYSISMVNSEILTLLSKAKIKPAVYDTNTDETERVLSSKFQKAIADSHFNDAAFVCKKAGEPYEYYEDYEDYEDFAYRSSMRKGTRRLQTKCTAANQNFIVHRAPAADLGQRETATPLVYVRDYNAPPVSVIAAVFGEYIQGPQSAPKF